MTHIIKIIPVFPGSGTRKFGKTVVKRNAFCISNFYQPQSLKCVMTPQVKINDAKYVNKFEM